MAKTSKVKKVLKITLIVFLSLLFLVGGYICYFVASFTRIQDNLALSPSGNVASQQVSTNVQYSLFNWNIGFGAYSDDYSFFMDGGKHSRAFSKDAVFDNLSGVVQTLNNTQNKYLQGSNFDFVCFQEVDFDSTRSYKVDQREILIDELAKNAKYTHIFAQNYNSPYILYPFNSPHGANKSGMLTFSKYQIQTAIRKQLPVESSLYKFFDLDRCYSKMRIKVSNGKDLVLINFHLSAYTSDGTIATEQLKLLLEDCKAEYLLGNYVVCAGDFNKDLFDQTSSKVFGIEKDDFNWAKTIDPAIFEGTYMTKVVPVGADEPVPTCRNANAPFEQGHPVYTVDGFLVSDNIDMVYAYAVDTQFAYSDHNPVIIKFRLTA